MSVTGIRAAMAAVTSMQPAVMSGMRLCPQWRKRFRPRIRGTHAESTQTRETHRRTLEAWRRAGDERISAVV